MVTTKKPQLKPIACRLGSARDDYDHLDTWWL